MKSHKKATQVQQFPLVNSTRKPFSHSCFEYVLIQKKVLSTLTITFYVVYTKTRTVQVRTTIKSHTSGLRGTRDTKKCSNSLLPTQVENLFTSALFKVFFINFNEQSAGIFLLHQYIFETRVYASFSLPYILNQPSLTKT